MRDKIISSWSSRYPVLEYNIFMKKLIEKAQSIKEYTQKTNLSPKSIKRNFLAGHSCGRENKIRYGLFSHFNTNYTKDRT